MTAVLEKTEAAESAPMKAAISLVHLQHALKVVGPAIPRGNASIPVLQSVRIEQLPEGLAIETTDLTLAIRALCPETSSLPRPVVIPADRFLSWVKLLAGDDVKLSATDRRATMHCGRTKATLPILTASAWPDNRIFKLDNEGITLKQSDLARALRFAFITVGTEERPALNGVLLVGDGTTLRMVSTDGHCMTIYTMPSAEKITLLLPARLIKALLPLLVGEDDGIDLAFNESMILASVAADTPVFVSCRKITGAFPSWEAVLPKEKRLEVSASARDFLLSLERCVLLSNAETSAVAVTFGEQIIIESSDPQAGEATETVDCVGSPKEPLRVGVNAGYLIQLLKRLEGDVRIALPKTNQSPLLFKATPKDGETLDYIVMPLRLEK